MEPITILIICILAPLISTIPVLVNAKKINAEFRARRSARAAQRA